MDEGWAEGTLEKGLAGKEGGETTRGDQLDVHQSMDESKVVYT